MGPEASKGHKVKHLHWLRGELSRLCDAQVLDADTAAGVRAYYGLDHLPAPRNLALLIFGVMGAALFGAGLILIFAHNWDELSRAARAGISLGLLVIAQALAGWVLVRKPQSAAWTEASALSLTLWIGASIALISQTYHIEGELGDFILSWLVLALPVFYFLKARVSATLCLLLSLSIPNAPCHLADRHAAYLVIAAACLPYVIYVRQRQAEQARTALLEWAASLTIPAGLAMVVLDALGSQDEVALLLFSAVFATMYAWGSRNESEAPGFASPVSTVGLFGVASLALTLSFEGAWPWGSFGSLHEDLAETPAILTALAALLLALYPLTRAVAEARARQWAKALALGFPLLVFAGSTLMPDHLAMVVGNLYAFGLGMSILLSGLDAMKLRRTNVGLAVLAMLFTLRFVDSDLSLLVRGFGMMIIGLAFAGVNVWLVRRQRNTELGDEGAVP
jgi:hypothetical protein